MRFKGETAVRLRNFASRVEHPDEWLKEKVNPRLRQRRYCLEQQRGSR